MDKVEIRIETAKLKDCLDIAFDSYFGKEVRNRYRNRAKLILMRINYELDNFGGKNGKV